jgi:MraZ protein
MLLGVYEHTIDDKGRLSVPARHREELGEVVILSPGWEGQIMVYPTEVWTRIAQKVAAQNQAVRDARKLTRYIYNVADCPVDKQGRILIPTWLRSHAQLDANVVIQGLNDRLEIWNAETWQKNWNALQDEGGDIAEQLAALGLWI